MAGFEGAYGLTASTTIQTSAQKMYLVCRSVIIFVFFDGTLDKHLSELSIPALLQPYKPNTYCFFVWKRLKIFYFSLCRLPSHSFNISELKYDIFLTKQLIKIFS